MAHITALADRLFMMAGVFEKYRATGGTFTAQEAQWLEAQLSACAAQAKADRLHAEHLMDELQAFEGGVTIPPVTRHVGILGVIDGGRA